MFLSIWKWIAFFGQAPNVSPSFDVIWNFKINDIAWIKISLQWWCLYVLSHQTCAHPHWRWNTPQVSIFSGLELLLESKAKMGNKATYACHFPLFNPRQAWTMSLSFPVSPDTVFELFSTQPSIHSYIDELELACKMRSTLHSWFRVSFPGTWIYM